MAFELLSIVILRLVRWEDEAAPIEQSSDNVQSPSCFLLDSEYILLGPGPRMVAWHDRIYPAREEVHNLFPSQFHHEAALGVSVEDLEP